MKTRKRQPRGFTLVEIMVVVAIVGLLSAIAVAGIHRIKLTATRTIVMNNLRQIYQAKEMYFSEGDSNQSGVLAKTLRDKGFISNTLWAGCFESNITLGYTYQSAFQPGASVWAGLATDAGGGVTSVSETIEYPSK